MSTSQRNNPADDCYRCGYDLRSIGDEQPCPECGLLARRSRRPTDELHLTRPRWLTRVSRGLVLILITLPLALLWPFVFSALSQWAWRPNSFPLQSHIAEIVMKYGALMFPVMLLVGVLMVTSREGYAPADHSDRMRRNLIRICATIPLVAILLVTYLISLSVPRLTLTSDTVDLILRTAMSLLTFGSAPLPLLLFIHLRSVARRIKSAHLAEHCMIAGIGSSLTLLLIGGVFWFVALAERWGFDNQWFSRSTGSLVLTVVPMVACVLFVLWAMYLLLRFAITFGRASRRLRREWKTDDRSLELSDPSSAT